MKAYRSKQGHDIMQNEELSKEILKTLLNHPNSGAVVVKTKHYKLTVTKLK